MKSDDDIRGAVIAYIKTKTSIVSELDTDAEVRERQWQGRDFDYPNIRVEITSNIPFSNCGSEITMNILSFSEQASSAQSTKTSGIINDVLNNRGFVSQSLNFILWTTGMIPAARSDDKTWRSGVSMRGIVSG